MINVHEPVELEDGTPAEIIDWYFDEDDDGNDLETGYMTVSFFGIVRVDGGDGVDRDEQFEYDLETGDWTGDPDHLYKRVRNVQAIDPRDFIEDLI